MDAIVVAAANWRKALLRLIVIPAVPTDHHCNRVVTNLDPTTEGCHPALKFMGYEICLW
jgi:hypothetical protein